MPRMGALLPLANETRADRTSAWKKCDVHGVVENQQAFIFGIKGWRSAVQLELSPGLFTGFLVDRRISFGWLALDNCVGRGWWLEND